MDASEKESIEREINNARDGIGSDIDELDRRLRKQLDFKTIASENAPQIIAGGAALGFLVGFGFPKPLRRLIKFGVPIALIAAKAKKIYDEQSAKNEFNPS
jgi:hypothetical protein